VSLLAQAELLLKEMAGIFPQEEDYKRYRWMCRGECDRDGKHRE
jgi:hypothetical protein